MRGKRIVSIVLIQLAVWMGAYSAPAAWAQKSPYDWALIQLDYVRQEKAQQLKRLTDKLHDLALSAAQDKRVLSFFEVNRQYYHALQKGQGVPLSLEKDVQTIRDQFNAYYIHEYFAFYEILFVNIDGILLHSIRKENDPYSSLVKHAATIGTVADVIARKPESEAFIDFYYYKPSLEPAAFFVEPVYKDGIQTGWILLQCAVNKLNSIFSSTSDLGQTGETFLVNAQGLMLTESYFKGNSTILKQHLDDKNIKAKFHDRAGHRVVTDYRGETALSSFEVFEFLGSKWLVVAKIDQDEITTRYYRKHKRYFQDLLLAHLKKNSVPGEPLPLNEPAGQPYRVDMDEFLKAEHGEILETYGVSTCTAVLAKMPGKFAYLAHLSTKDKMYDGQETNLLAQMTKKIKSFDIYPYEFRKVQFVMVAPHLESLPNIIDHLLENGFFLSQIKVAYSQSARSVAVVYDYQRDVLQIKWKMEDGSGRLKETTNNSIINPIHVIEQSILNI